MESIFDTTKKMIGLDVDDHSFDVDILMDINAVLGILVQMGVGTPITVTGPEQVWSDFLGENSPKEYDLVKPYVYAKVRMIFDPPSSSVLKDALASIIDEFEWRTNFAAESLTSD